jgi:type IV pilus assembly protein PilV
METSLKSFSRPSGFTLLEVLIAILVLSFGLLGLAALQAYSLKTNQSANFRSQATALANMMMDNIRANRASIADYYSNTYESVECDEPLDESAMSAQDLAVWRQQIACQLPMGSAAIAPISATEVAVCIRWSDARWESDEQPEDSTCTADAAEFRAGLDDDGPGAGTDGPFSVFVVSSRM